MNLKPTLVKDLPLSGFVSFSNDISNYVENALSSYVNAYVQNYVSAYVNNFLNRLTYDNSNIMTRPLSNVIVNMTDAMSNVIKSFGGHVINDLSNSENQHNDVSADETSYVVMFFDYDGTLLDSQLIAHGNNAIPPQNPTREGYVFTGWQPSYLNVQQNLNIVAQYREETNDNEHITFSFYTDTSSLISAVVAEYGSDVAAPQAPSKTGWHFSGWSPDTWQDYSNDCSVYATYEPNQYTVSFNGAGGAPEYVSSTVTYGQSYGALPSCQYEDGIFEGWFNASSDGTQIISSTIVETANDHTLYAHWIDNDAATQDQIANLVSAISLLNQILNGNSYEPELSTVNADIPDEDEDDDSWSPVVIPDET